MSKKIIFCCLAMVVSLIQLVIGSPAIVIKDNPHVQLAQQMFTESLKNRSYAYPYNVFWNSLCANNADSDYQNPGNCGVIIKCSGKQVFLEPCPGNLIFNPIKDSCDFPPTTPPYTEQCPWPSIWKNTSNLRCDKLGKRVDQPPLLLPTNPMECCGRSAVLCSRDFDPQIMEAPPGFGYSKAYLAFLEYDTCKIVDKGLCD